MKITEKLQKAEREGRTYWSFEFFPPRTAQVSCHARDIERRLTHQGLQNLYDRIERMRNLGPEFIDITWGAGGKNADLTSSLVQVCQETIGLECCMHLCCTESESLHGRPCSRPDLQCQRKRWSGHLR